MQIISNSSPQKTTALHFACCNLHFDLFFIVIFLLSLTLSSKAQRNVSEHAKSTITPFLMKQTISYLASDSMKGRATPSTELDVAGEYIAMQFKSFGLKPVHGSYFQDLGFCFLDLGADNFLSVVDGLETKNFKLKDDFVPYDMSGSRPAEGDIVFAGYGITAPEYNYDDYKDLDVRGKIVAILRQEPGQTDSAGKLFAGPEMTRYSELKEKQKMAQEHGAIGMLVISGPLQYSSLKPRGYSWPSLSKILPKDALPLEYCTRSEEKIPMVHVGESMIVELFENVDSLKRVQQRIEKSMQPASFPIPGKIMAMNVSLTSKPVGGRNVIAMLEGSDPGLKDEVVIVGGHYDHIGMRKEHPADSDYIFNGADDNASGTGGMLAIAKAFASLVETPRRSVMFMAFAGEERGLLGSATYVRNPLWPIVKTVAMLNLDMIGRNNPDSLEIIGARQNPGLVKVVRKQNKATGFKLRESKDERLDGGSDHASFFEKGVPVIFFFTGFHPDYHQVTDSPDRINTDKAARVARLAFLTAWTVANESKHYKIVKPAPGKD
ncbi:MAG: M28 family peptidase [Bacteroidetes bacterium]|nr:M28 family peptidase [Bacteroidota bacterium]